jgi:hypothetical protein
MKFLTRDILPFYKENEENSWYLDKFFTNTSEVGNYSPFQEGTVSSSRRSEGKEVDTIDEVNTYKINSIGCRGEIDEDSDILASGCSITFGLGVPELGTWPNLLSKKINRSVTNLGGPGASVESICFNIIQYCLNTKMPKEIFCLMPDFFRSMIVVDKEFYKSKVNRGLMGTLDPLGYVFCNPKVIKDGKSFFMEVEDKKYVEDSISPHQLIMNSIRYIYMLEAFCSSNNIKLYWSVWDPPSSYILEELVKNKDFKLKNFSSFYPPDSDYNGPGSMISWYCKPENHEHELKDHASWSNGSDYAFIDGKKTFKNSHPGIHTQEHFADFFYNIYNEDK